VADPKFVKTVVSLPPLCRQYSAPHFPQFKLWRLYIGLDQYLKHSNK